MLVVSLALLLLVLLAASEPPLTLAWFTKLAGALISTFAVTTMGG